MSRIKVTKCFDQFLVWNLEDVSKLKLKWRIIGSMIGVHTETHYQSEELGLPLQLSKFETMLLKEQNAIDLYEISLTELTSHELGKHQKLHLDAFETFQSELLKEKQMSIMTNRESIIQKARERRNLGANVSDQEIIDEKLDEASQSITLDRFRHAFEKECPHESRMKLIDTEIILSNDEECKFLVYKELWSKGYFITPGHKFSCDFLVYEGDPELFHAKYMVICRDEKSVSALEIALKCRLSVQVNKELLIANFDSDNKMVEFTNISWKGK